MKVWYNPATKDFLRTKADVSAHGYEEVAKGSALWQQAQATFKSWGLTCHA